MPLSKLSTPAGPRRYDASKERTQRYIGDYKASLNEYNVAQALTKLKLPFEFQVSFYGGRRFRGGIIVDFVVQTVPLATPMWVHGNYWHKGAQKARDQYQEATLFFQLRGELQPPVIIWGDESDTEEKAYQTVRKRLNL